MRQLIDHLLSRWYVRTPRYLALCEKHDALLSERNADLRRQIVELRHEAQAFYVDSAGHYWPIVPSLTQHGLPCS